MRIRTRSVSEEMSCVPCLRFGIVSPDRVQDSYYTRNTLKPSLFLGYFDLSFSLDPFPPLASPLIWPAFVSPLSAFAPALSSRYASETRET
jgi:hypothetical protein